MTAYSPIFRALTRDPAEVAGTLVGNGRADEAEDGVSPIAWELALVVCTVAERCRGDSRHPLNRASAHSMPHQRSPFEITTRQSSAQLTMANDNRADLSIEPNHALRVR